VAEPVARHCRSMLDAGGAARLIPLEIEWDSGSNTSARIAAKIAHDSDAEKFRRSGIALDKGIIFTIPESSGINVVL
jgi:hypothetical protein